LTTFRSLSGDHHAERWIPQVLPWLQEAGDPYYRWFFGGIIPTDRTQSLLADWMRRRSSELSIERAVLLVTGECALGGFIALGGADLQACRRADALAVLQAAGRQGQSLLRERIRDGRNLFGPVAADELYLSKLGVARGLRRAGYGAKILQRYIDRGAADGFRRFRLDVWAENRPAIGLYWSFGFQVVRELRNDRAGMTYLNMVLELREDDEGRSIRGRD
jgi:[ribosomal protein S18]-alanine N-acetyltransferase